MRIFLMHDTLRDEAGHAFPESLGWARACRERGHDLAIFAHSGARASLLAATGARPLFRLTDADFARYLSATDKSDQAETRSDALFQFVLASRQLERGCREAWAAAERRPDLVVFPFAGSHALNAAAEWLADVAPAERPKLLFNMPRPEATWTLDAERRQCRATSASSASPAGGCAPSCRRAAWPTPRSSPDCAR